MEDIDRKLIIGFGVIIGILVITVVIISIYSRKKDNVTIKLKDILGKLCEGQLKISDTDFKRIKIFERDRRIYLTKSSLEWKDNSGIFSEVCNFAVRLLIFYHHNPAVGIYMTVANDIVRKINDLVLQPHNYNIIRNSQGTNWIVFVNLLRLLNTFEYLADEDFLISKKICHEQILELVPGCTKLYLEESVRDEKAIYSTTARLLTNFLFNKELYKADIENNKALKILKDNFDILEKSKDKKFVCYDTYKSLYNVFRSLN
ncbi:GSCOCT00005230001.2-RA-CDS [Cotesia congregata]|uniref:Cc_odve66_13 n=1 Tax=Cotesia congregata TaxID=51543 RepID=A0A8J2HLJ9_COTCN|nr:GSCOCT00005230001.2-RA-CDS [Cotesia congregata]CAG5101838.1 Cc_odve66_13 [Cotesia congregata]